jgi:phosphotriesterase-related protein
MSVLPWRATDVAHSTMVASTVPTLTGPTPVDGLGPALSHERIIGPGPTGWSGPVDDVRIAEAVRRLRELRAAGFTTVLDPTTVGPGRDMAAIRRVVSEVSGVDVVLATGIDPGSGVGWGSLGATGIVRGTAEPLVDHLLRDLTEGIDGTAVRAGFLVCTIDEAGLVIGVERALRAVGTAHAMTGAPIMVRTDPLSTTGLDVAHILENEDVDPRCVVLAHSGDTTDVDHLAELAGWGYLLGMDRFGAPSPSFDARVSVISELCRRGHGGSMLLSREGGSSPRMLGSVVPALRERGVDEADIHAILVDTPRRWLGC